MIKQLKKLLSPVLMAIAFTAPQLSQAMEAEQVKVEEKTEKAVVLFPNVISVSDTQALILTEVVKDGSHEFGFVGNIGSVCKAWYNFVNEEQHISPFYKAPQVNLITKCIHDCRIDSDEYMNFYNGELIYRPTLGSDEGMITLKISDCLNLSKGIFNLSDCGDVGKYLSISIGYRKGIIPENKEKIEIWFARRKFIEKELKEGRATQFADIFKDWKPEVQVGIFWTWGNDVNLGSFDYLVTSDSFTLGSKNLYEDWCGALRRGCACGDGWGVVSNKKFHVYFK